jgi:hypothetical protein
MDVPNVQVVCDLYNPYYRHPKEIIEQQQFEFNSPIYYDQPNHSLGITMLGTFLHLAPPQISLGACSSCSC